MIGPSWTLGTAQLEIYRLEAKITRLEADRRELVGLVAEMIAGIDGGKGLPVREWRAKLAKVLEGGR